MMNTKKLFFFAIAALGLAACSNDEVVETIATSEANEINFRPLTTGMTRAADAHFNTIGDNFKVTAFPTGTTTTAYFSNEVFTKQSSDATYSSSTKHYWPSAINLDFFAWSPASLSNDYSSIAVTPGATIGSQVDLVYAKTVNWGKLTGDGTVATHQIGDTYKGITINFRHAESKVIIKLKNTNSSLKFTVQDVSICNVNTTGTFAFTTANTVNTDTQDDGNLRFEDWTSNTSGSYTVTLTNETAYTEFAGIVAARNLTNAAASHEMILIPQTLTKQNKYASSDNNAAFNGPCIKVNLKIQNNADDSYIVNDGSANITAMWPLETHTWNPGYAYTYTVDLAQGGYYSTNQNDGDADLDPVLEGAEIMFVTVTVDGWDAQAIDVAAPAFASTLAATGTKTINIAANATGHFSIEVTGISDSNITSLTESNGNISNVTSTRVGTTLYITGLIAANATASPVTSTLTLVDGASATTTINIVQAAAN